MQHGQHPGQDAGPAVHRGQVWLGAHHRCSRWDCAWQGCVSVLQLDDVLPAPRLSVKTSVHRQAARVGS